MVTESATASGSSPARRLLVKICGLRDPHQASAIAALGVDAIGVVAVPGSPRFLAVEHRAKLFAAARAGRADILGVLVVADPGDLEVASLRSDHGHQVVQLHGSESVRRCQMLRSLLGPELQLWKALRLRSQADLDRCHAYGEVVDALLLDAWVPDQLGGTGRSIPPHWLAGFRPALPWWLAGGLTPDNVADVLQVAQPDGIDVSSGVEERPGWKSLERVTQLLAQLNRVPVSPEA